MIDLKQVTAIMDTNTNHFLVIKPMSRVSSIKREPSIRRTWRPILRENSKIVAPNTDHKMIKYHLCACSGRIKTMARRKSSKFVKIWLLTCLIACLYHSYMVTIDYTTYRSITNVQIFQPRIIDNISISICVFKIFLFKFGDKNYATIGTYDEFIRESTNIADSVTEIQLREVTMRGKNSEYSSSGKSYNLTLRMTEFLRLLDRCVRINLDLKEDNGISQNFLRLDIAVKHFSFLQDRLLFSVSIHESNKFPHLYDTFPIKELYRNQSITNGKRMAIEKMTKFNLKYPFESNCIDYKMKNNIEEYENSEEIFESRGDCYEHCVEKSTMKTGAWARYKRTVPICNETVCAKNRFNGIMDRYNMFPFLNRTKEVEIEEKCLNICHDDCKSIRYILSTRGSYDPFIAENFEVVIDTDLPETIIVYQAYIELISYLIFVAGVISMWLGSSFYGTPIDVCKKIVTSIQK